MTVAPFLFCSDLDRTLIPNGPQPESPGARRLLHRLAAHPALTLVYVSGRDQGLIRQAIHDYRLPPPAYAIGDVGTSLYRIEGDHWHREPAWAEEIAPDWNGRDGAALHTLLAKLPGLELQEPSRQNRYKLSYYTAPDLDRDALLGRAQHSLAVAGVRANLIWSLDEKHGTGLLDVLPRSASKLHAIRFLSGMLEAPARRIVFAGDSGNDLEVLTSEIPSVLVANAVEELRREAQELAEARGHAGALYLAAGGLLGMNGNYAAGALEGVCHFLPELLPWLREAA